MNTEIFNAGSCSGQGCLTHRDILQAGSCDSDSCGCLTHKNTLQAGSCDSDSCGCFSHKEILMA